MEIAVLLVAYCLGIAFALVRDAAGTGWGVIYSVFTGISLGLIAGKIRRKEL